MRVHIYMCVCVCELTGVCMRVLSFVLICCTGRPWPHTYIHTRAKQATDATAPPGLLDWLLKIVAWHTDPAVSHGAYRTLKLLFKEEVRARVYDDRYMDV